jgi:hypothetical protein
VHARMILLLKRRPMQQREVTIIGEEEYVDQIVKEIIWWKFEFLQLSLGLISQFPWVRLPIFCPEMRIQLLYRRERFSFALASHELKLPVDGCLDMHEHAGPTVEVASSPEAEI